VTSIEAAINSSRRKILISAGAMAAMPALWALMTACDGSDSTPAVALSMDEQLALPASQVVSSIENGNLSAETYITTLLARAEKPAGLNSIITLNKERALAAAPDVKNGFQAIVKDEFGPAYADAINVYRLQLQRIFARYFSDNNIGAIFFPTVPVPAAPIDSKNAASTISVNGGPPVDEFATIIRTMGPDSDAGLPSLSLPAGQTPSGLPAGMEIDGPVGTDKRILGIGMAMESLFGTLPAPKL
jgi:Asp-tRNA(Asn)/Glu-tRNA(Gln) amidotransferase A subunit family amidase